MAKTTKFMKMIVGTVDVAATIILEKPYMLFASINSFEHTGNKEDSSVTAPATHKGAIRDMYLNYVNAFASNLDIPVTLKVLDNGDVLIAPDNNVKVNSFDVKAAPVNAQMTDEHNVVISIDYTRFKFDLE
jgi:glutamate mutase epsilon subunit